MPSQAIALTATYKDTTITNNTYGFTLNNGSGAFVAGTQITITAAAPPAGKVFDKWTGDTSCIASATSATTVVTIPLKAINLTATYKVAPQPHKLTVKNGSGSGSFVKGQVIAITANPPAKGMVFDKWVGNSFYIANIKSATTTVTMPNANFTVTASYKRKK